MKPPRPSAEVTLGGRTLTAAEAGLASLRIHLARGCHDSAELNLWPRSRFASANPGDVISIRLGFAGEEEDVWSGEVTFVENTPGLLRITGHAPTAALSHERKSQTYVGQTVSQIVRDLASSIDIDEVSVDAELSYYAVDHCRVVWGHLCDLATLSGSEILSSANGGLRFVPVNTLPSATLFRHGAELLDWCLGPAAEGTRSKYAAHGSASEAGSDKWHWPNADPTSGAGESRVMGMFHSRSLADDLTAAADAAARREAVSGDLELVGQPTLRPGDVFNVAGLESGDSGPLRATGVRHHLDGVQGFRTRALVEAASGGLPGLP